MGEYRGVVFQEGGYSLSFANTGQIKKPKPRIQNLSRSPMKCLDANCDKQVRNMNGYCNVKHRPFHTHDWVGLLDPPGVAPPHFEMAELLLGWARGKPEREARADAFVQDALVRIVGKVPDATTMQEDFVGKRLHPDTYVKLIRELVDTHFPADHEKLDGGKYRNIPTRVVAGTYATGLLCEEANRGDLWWCRNKVGDEARSEMASAFMPTVYYWLRRYTHATPTQARKSHR